MSKRTSIDQEAVARHWDLKDLLDQSSVGAGLRDIEERGIEAHLEDLEQEMTPKWRGRYEY